MKINVKGQFVNSIKKRLIKGNGKNLILSDYCLKEQLNAFIDRRKIYV